MNRLIEKASFAEKVGVSRSAVTQASKPGHALFEALENEMINLDSIACKRYLAKKKLTEQQLLTLGLTSADLNNLHEAVAPAVAKPQASPEHEMNSIAGTSPRGSALDMNSTDLMNHFGNKTLFQIIAEHGSDNAFQKVIQAMKQVADVEEKRLKLSKQRGEVIDRELVKRHLFGAIESGNVRLLNDLPGNITRTVYSAAKAKQTPEEAEKEVREMISSVLSEVKATAKRNLSYA